MSQSVTLVDPRTFDMLVRDGSVCENCGAWGHAGSVQKIDTCCSFRCSVELRDRQATTDRIRADGLARYGSAEAWSAAMSRAFLGTAP